MIKCLKSLAAMRPMRPFFYSGDKRHLGPLLAVVDFLFLAAHSYFFCVFFFWRLPGAAWANGAALGLCLFALRLLGARRYGMAGLLPAAGGILYATLMGILTGAGTYFIAYHILIAGVQMALPCGRAKTRGLVVGACVLGATGVLLADRLLPTPLPLPPGLVQLLFFSHTYLLLFGAILVLGVSNAAKQSAQRLSDARMAELSSQAYLDPLTGLYNRRYADRYFQYSRREGARDMVAILDVDDFKQVNDQLGHCGGDAVLSFVAAFLRQHTRKSDAVFRWGGEEFLIVLSDVDGQAAYQVLDKLRRELAESPIQTDRGPVGVTVTIGMAPLRYEDVPDSIRLSDERLYRGKREGKNQVVA